MSSRDGDLPLAGRDDDAVPGHWLLARLGKRVLRPGGVKLTRTLLGSANLADADVVELAPGLGRTASEIIRRRPRSYVGIDRDPDAARRVNQIVAGRGEVRVGDASNTGLPDASADVVIGEAMLTMQGDKTKDSILAEVVRLLRPGGRYAIHELALTPDTLGDEVKTEVRQALARSIKINARPLTRAEWQQLLTEHGLVTDHMETVPMALLQPRRLVADEGLWGALRFARNLLALPDARRRVLGMRRTFRHYRDHLVAVAVVAHKRDDRQTDGVEPPGAGRMPARLATSPATARSSSTSPAPEIPRWLRAAFRLPDRLYRSGLGSLLGHRFLRLTHRGRRTGSLRTTVLEIVAYDRRVPEFVVVSGFGARADWLRNIEAGGSVEVTVGRRTFPVEHRRLELEEAVGVFADYERRNRVAGPILRRALSWLLGWRYDGSPDARLRMARQLPLIAFRPRGS